MRGDTRSRWQERRWKWMMKKTRETLLRTHRSQLNVPSFRVFCLCWPFWVCVTNLKIWHDSSQSGKSDVLKVEEVKSFSALLIKERRIRWSVKYCINERMNVATYSHRCIELDLLRIPLDLTLTATIQIYQNHKSHMMAIVPPWRLLKYTYQTTSLLDANIYILRIARSLEDTRSSKCVSLFCQVIIIVPSEEILLKYERLITV